MAHDRQLACVGKEQSSRADLVCEYARSGSEALHRLRSHLGFALADVLPAEQELAVEVAGVNRVHIDLQSPGKPLC